MKLKTATALCAAMLALGIYGCGAAPAPVQDAPSTETAEGTGTEEPQNESSDNAIDLEAFPFEGTWGNDEGTVYLRIHGDGSMVSQSVMTMDSTTTRNGVTTHEVTKSLNENQYDWTLNGTVFMFGSIELTPAVDGGTFMLVGEKITYTRVGNLDYVIDLSVEEEGASELEAAPYTLGSVISAEGAEVVFDEAGVAADIRITSNSSGLQMTSGPSVYDDAKYVYVRGTVKNTGTSEVRPAIAGQIVVDGYEYRLSVDVIGTDGAPASRIAPLDTVYVLLYAKVPNELADSFDEATVTFGFNDNFGDVELGSATYLYSVTVDGQAQ